MLKTPGKIIRASVNHPAPQHGIGVVKGNPKRCLICMREIKNGEAWTKHTSPADPQFGAYSVIVHDHCHSAER